MIFVKISQNFIKSHLKICLISQISAHRLWHVCYGMIYSLRKLLKNQPYICPNVLFDRKTKDENHLCSNLHFQSVTSF